MSAGVKIPDIIRHENDLMATVDSNDVRGIYISDTTFADFDPSTISIDRRRKSFLLSCFNAVYQYVGSDISETRWTNKDNWRPVQGAFVGGENYIKIIRTANEISRTCGLETPYVACYETGIIYKYLQDASDYRGIGADRCIDTKDGGNTGYVDINFSDYYLVKTNNLSDVADRQTAIDNLCITPDVESGQYLYFDGEHMSFKNLPDIMTIKGRVDTVEELYEKTDVSVGDVYLVGEEGSGDFQEYVCISVEGSAPEWEYLGKKQTDHPWVFEGEFNSIKLYNHGLVNDGSDEPYDSVTLDGKNGTSFSAQNITQGVNTENTVTFASNDVDVRITGDYYKSANNVVFGSDNVSIYNGNNVTLAASSNITLINFRSWGGGSGESSVAPVRDGLNNILFVSNNGNNSNVCIANTNSIYGANEFYGDHFIYTNIDGNVSSRNILLGNIFDSESEIKFSGTSNSFINNSFIQDSEFWTNYPATFNNNTFIGNEISLINTFGLNNSIFIGSKIYRGNRLSGNYISSYNSYIYDFLIEGNKTSIINSEAYNFSIYGNNNLILNSNLSSFTINGKYSSVDSCYSDGGCIGFSSNSYFPSYNKIMASEIRGTTQLKYSTIQSSYINGGTWNYDENTDNEKIFIASTRFEGFTIGKRDNDVIIPATYSSILSSYSSGLTLYGNYNTYISGKGGEYLGGDHNTIICGSYSNNITGSSNTLISTTNISLTGETNICGSSVGGSISGNKNTVFSSSGCNMLDNIIDGSDTIDITVSNSSIISSASVTIQDNASFISVIACPGNVLDDLTGIRGYESFTLYTRQLCADSIIANRYIGAMSFVGSVYEYEDLPNNVWSGSVYKVESMIEVYSGGGSGGSDVPIGYYPAGTCWVYDGTSWNSLGGFIYYATEQEIDDATEN